jgi:antitoxin VapB
VPTGRFVHPAGARPGEDVPRPVARLPATPAGASLYITAVCMDVGIMPISIRDPETDRLAREVAALTGETITGAIAVALRERLAREKARRRGGRVQRLLALGERCASHMDQPFSSTDHGDLLYDEAGLPR